MSDLYRKGCDGKPHRAMNLDCDATCFVPVEDDLYVKRLRQKAKCWHTGSYQGHDEGCFEWRYEPATDDE